MRSDHIDIVVVSTPTTSLLNHWKTYVMLCYVMLYRFDLWWFSFPFWVCRSV